MAKLEPLEDGTYLWYYVPSLAASVIFLILFSAVTIYHIWKLIRTKVRFTIPFAIGGLFEIVGYAARIAARDNTGSLIPYVIQSIFILLAPTLFAAAVYMVLARVIRAVNGEEHSPIRFNAITKIFVCCDIITFLVQGEGAGQTAQGSDDSSGQYIVLGGLVLQILTFMMFVITAIIFSQRMDRAPTSAAMRGDVPWKKHLYSLYTISSMILLRSIFRAIEYGLGTNGYLMEHEWPAYVFDALPMFVSMVCFGVWYPSSLQPFLKTPTSA